MPLPTPSSTEDEKSFISRCMVDDIMKKEFPDNKQRVAVCYAQRKKRHDEGVLYMKLLEKIDKHLNETVMKYDDIIKELALELDKEQYSTGELHKTIRIMAHPIAKIYNKNPEQVARTIHKLMS
jgi:hypothetical protein